MKKFLSLVLATLLLITSLGGCGGGAASTGSSSGDAKSGYNIAVILKTTSSEYWGYVVAGCNAYMKDNPEVKVTVTGPPSETSFDEQVSMIETAIDDATVDGYVFAPLQSETVAKLIAGKTKPMVAVDTNINAPEILSFIGTGNEEAAKLAKENGWEEINCIEISGVQGDATNTARLNGYKAGVEAEGGKFLDNEVQYANGVADQAVTAMEGIMQRFPEGIAIICANNDDMAQAAARTAKGNAAYEKTIFLGFDGTLSACNSILNGEETMSVAQQPYEMGYKSVEAVVNALKGESLPKFIDSGAGVVTPTNAQERKNQLTSY
jgi:ribose transport system substrate-binding protein